MEITIEMIEQVLDAVDTDYRKVKQALIDAEGDVDRAIDRLKEDLQEEPAPEAEDTSKGSDTEEAKEADLSDSCDCCDGTENAENAEKAEKAEKDIAGKAQKAAEDFASKIEEAFTSDEYAEKLIDRLKRRIEAGNVDRIVVSRGDTVLLNISLNMGILGGLLGLVTVPWALLLATLTAYGTNCKIEIVGKDGKHEDMGD